MRVMTQESDAFSLDLALSSLHADGSDIQLMFRLLLERLGGVLGGRLRVDRSGRFRKDGAIRRVEIELQDAHLIAELSEGLPRFLIAKVSGGIRIRTETTDVAGWISTLLAALQEEAAHSMTTRQALESIVIGGQ